MPAHMPIIRARAAKRAAGVLLDELLEAVSGELTEDRVAKIVADIRPGYLAADKETKGTILDALCSLTGFRRKSLIRALGRTRGGGTRTGRPAVYGRETAEALFDLWNGPMRRADDRRMAAGAGRVARQLVRKGRRSYPERTLGQLDGVSPSTVRRLLQPLRPGAARRRRRRRPGGNSHRIRALTPVRPHREQNDAVPGWVQADTVHHGGPSSEGRYVCTLTCVDEATGWIALRALPRLGGNEVASALDRMRRRWPVPIAHLQTDNGAEFMNRAVELWAERNGVRRSRGRPRRSNDQARVEERNAHVVREAVGDARFEGAAAVAALDELYAALCDLLNFFMPVRRSTGERRENGRTVRRYGKPSTPCDRLLASDALDADGKRRLAARREMLDPDELNERADAALDVLERLER